jgi:hypothetical protein
VAIGTLTITPQNLQGINLSSLFFCVFPGISPFLRRITGFDQAPHRVERINIARRFVGA